MHPPITHADLSTLIDEADAAARRLRRKLVPAALPIARISARTSWST